ncbi:MAG TPA: SDR family oxidoreductase [Candidatus Limnocylindrales bacterium]
MPALRVLFIGGTGTISSACVEAAVHKGFDLTVLNRGASESWPPPPEVKLIRADVRDANAVREALGGQTFDVVADFIAFTPEHVRTDLELFTGVTGQYIFISSASAYQTPPLRLPVVESTPLRNPEWDYSRNKIACEDELVRAYRETGFPMTIVRPSHTYARTSVPLVGGRTALQRMRKGLPVVVHGDGTSLWVLTHHRDFATAFTGLLGNPLAVGDSFHITSDEVLSWNQIYAMFAAALGVEPHLVHVPSHVIAQVLPHFGPGLLGDKAHSMVFDNSKVKAVVPGFQATIPFAVGVREIVEWNAGQPDDHDVDDSVSAAFDELAQRF